MWLKVSAFVAVAAITAQVVDVYDGDTFTVELNGDHEHVRLIGVDAPELGDELGIAARDYLASLIAGETVTLILGVRERDRWGRLLADVYVNGLFINLEMVRAGYAVTYTVPPDVAHAEEFLEAEREARAEGRGLWENKEEK